MTRDVAFGLVRAWAEHVRTSLDDLVMKPDGSFHGQVGSVAFEYEASKSLLMARGYVTDDGQLIVKVPGEWQRLERLAEREKESVAGATFELEPEGADPEAARVVHLRLDFSIAMSRGEFVDRVQDLADASTYWDSIRLLEVSTTPDSVLERQWEARRKRGP